PPPSCTLLPYATLFRSRPRELVEHVLVGGALALPHAIAVIGRLEQMKLGSSQAGDERLEQRALGERVARAGDEQHRQIDPAEMRSEEHTSELQSRENLV